MSRAHLLPLVLCFTFAFLAVECGSDGETKHYKYIGNAEWSPVSNNTMIISKDEFDVTTGKSSGCANEVVDEIPPPVSYDLFVVDTLGRVIRQLTAGSGLAPTFRIKWSPRGDRFLIWGNPFPALHIVDT